jgi:hypothetical protein
MLAAKTYHPVVSESIQIAILVWRFCIVSVSKQGSLYTQQGLNYFPMYGLPLSTGNFAGLNPIGSKEKKRTIQ